MTSNFWRAQLLSQFGWPLLNPSCLLTVWVVSILLNNLLLVGPELLVWHQEKKWLLQTTECSNSLTKSAIFTWTSFTHCCFKFVSFGNLCIVCPVLFESVQNWMTQCFTIMKKFNILKQTVCKKVWRDQQTTTVEKTSMCLTRLKNETLEVPPVMSQER